MLMVAYRSDAKSTPNKNKSAPKSKTVGRYDFRGDEFRPAAFGRPPPSVNVRTSVVAIADPYNPGKRLLASVNRRTDLLEYERAHGTISEAAYLAGRVSQAVFERARGPGGASNWQGGSRIDASTASELAVIHGLEDARKIHAYVLWMRGEIGKFDTALLVSILRDRKSYAECATMELELGERGISYIAKRFRRALKSLADSRAARGSGLD